MINIFNYTNYREYLRDCFNDRKKRDKFFSHRWLSQHLGLSTSNLILLVMQGKRNLTMPVAIKLSGVLKHNPKQAEYFVNMVSFLQAKVNQERDMDFNRMLNLHRHGNTVNLAAEQYAYYSNWYNIIVRELVMYPDFKDNYNWLAKKVFPSITPTQARKSVQLLEKL
jgi:uncharacterized protein (TIGR02147 family)